MTGDAAVDGYLREVTARLEAVLGERLLGVYASGSVALGGYEPGRSDIDVLAVVDEPPAPGARDELVARCRHEALPCPARKLELVVYPVAEARAPSDPVRWWLNLNTGADQPLHVGADPLSEPGHWFLLDLALVRAHGIALAGPPPAELIADVPPARVRRAQAEAVAWWAAHDPGEATMAAAARAWRYAERGDFVTKRDALRWALTRLRR